MPLGVCGEVPRGRQIRDRTSPPVLWVAHTNRLFTLPFPSKRIRTDLVDPIERFGEEHERSERLCGENVKIVPQKTHKEAREKKTTQSCPFELKGDKARTSGGGWKWSGGQLREGGREGAPKHLRHECKLAHTLSSQVSRRVQ